jgi:glyoxylase-like metal-dependent hydrolase (beta-lactamase superfamily II)
MEFKVLIKGYAREEEDAEYVSCTTTLVKDNNLNILVDPGMNKPLLKESLSKENLSFEDIHYVILTHTDTDHMLLTALFTKAKVVDAWQIYTFDGKIVSHEDKIPGSFIKLLKTPGHSNSHTAVILENTSKGTVVIAGDVFWWWDSEEQKTDYESLISKKDPYTSDKEKLISSRKKVIEIADYIIPGHGEMFKVDKS